MKYIGFRLPDALFEAVQAEVKAEAGEDEDENRSKFIRDALRDKLARKAEASA
ncbi:MAG TPA: ribbon-helix-helix domain-containing protein [Methanolinea sp.]|nr:ribbon-helix-helix domain-containing protein [Methanolinea sp.]HQJ88451.1 ribbon-helix-helix domain-containing protein [Methanoregulaceae archaeon]